MSRVIRKVISNPVKVIKEVVAGVGAATGGTPDQPAPTAVEPTTPAKPATKPKDAVKPKPATGAVAGQSADARSRATQRRGRRSNVMTGSRGVTGTTTTTKKTLLGG